MTNYVTSAVSAAPSGFDLHPVPSPFEKPDFADLWESLADAGSVALAPQTPYELFNVSV